VIAPVLGDVEVFRATENVTVPLPVPSVGPVTVIHDGLADALHSQVGADAVTVMSPLTPRAGASTEVGDTLNVHGAAAWFTVTDWPAMVSEALRGEVVVCAAAEYSTVPFPLPLAPEVTVSHESELAAVQPQPAGAVTVMLPVPPSAATDCVVLESVYVHEGVVTAPACVTLKAMPAIVSVADRSAEAALGLTRNLTSPGPTPDPPAVTTSQDAELFAVHEHPLSANRSTDPSPPADPIAALDAVSENSHAGGGAGGGGEGGAGVATAD
jgi:hypothetical protein